jgi:uncharacterized protein YecT (DUF1311 family)
VEFPFFAEIPKTPEVELPYGRITVRLPDQTIAKVTCASRRDDPFTDDRALAEADRQLNETYATLVKRLEGLALERPRNEQRIWIQQRDSAALDIVQQNAGDENLIGLRNRSLRESTQSRNAELKTRL